MKPTFIPLAFSCLLLINFIHGSRAQLLTTITPEITCSTIRDQSSSPKAISLLNKSKSGATIQQIQVIGPHAKLFKVADASAFPLLVKPQYKARIPVIFNPAGRIGTFRATLQITTTARQIITVPVYGLSAKGMEGNNEPPLNLVLQTLGYQINPGGIALRLGTSAHPIGDEVPAPLFRKAGSGPVSIKPVARYSPAEAVPFGYYLPAAPLQLKTLGILSKAYNQHQTVFPSLVSGQPAFDPGLAPFGFFTRTKKQIAYTQDHINTAVSHRVRTYPLKDRHGRAVPNSYLICFEEANNGDYQDFMFVVSNIKPARQ